MTKKHISLTIVTAALFAVATFLTACGGGGGGSAAPAPRTTAHLGEIESLGSIIVNGVEFEIEGAELETETETHIVAGPTDDALKPGVIVKVSGETGADRVSGTAFSIVAKPNLIGSVAAAPVEVMPAPHRVRTLSVMGQTVLVEDNLTKFDDTPATLAQGEMIEVHGFPTLSDGAPALQATRIEVNAGGIFEIKGIIDAVPTATTFTIHNLTVDFASATVDGTVAAGSLVEAKGSFAAGPPATLTATSVEINPGLGGGELEAEVEGFITSLSGQTFIVNGQLVDFGNAVFEGGVRGDLAVGVKVEAEGDLTGVGSINARKVVFKESVRFEGDVLTKNANSIILNGLPEIEIFVNPTVTDFRSSDGSIAVPDLVNGIAVGENVRARGRQIAGTNNVMATRMEGKGNADNRIRIQGPVTGFSATSRTVTLMGITVDTSTISSFQDHDDAQLTEAQFFILLASGRNLVKARANVSGAGARTWTEIELED